MADRAIELRKEHRVRGTEDDQRPARFQVLGRGPQFGAVGFNWLAAAIGAKRAVVVSLAIWSATLIYIYAAVTTTLQFFLMAAVVAIVMGGSQALSRSLFAQLIPKGREAEYFSLYEISDKGTSWLCPLLFGLALQFTKSYRIAILSLIVFFIAGLLVLLRVDVEQGERDVARLGASFYRPI